MESFILFLSSKRTTSLPSDTIMASVPPFHAGCFQLRSSIKRSSHDLSTPPPSISIERESGAELDSMEEDDDDREVYSAQPASSGSFHSASPSVISMDGSSSEDEYETSLYENMQPRHKRIRSCGKYTVADLTSGRMRCSSSSSSLPPSSPSGGRRCHHKNRNAALTGQDFQRLIISEF